MKVTLTYPAIVSGVRNGCSVAETELYYLMVNTLQHYFYLEIGQCAMDRLHEAYIDVLVAIRRNKIAQPDSLLFFVRCIGRRRVFRQIEANITKRNRSVSLEALATMPGFEDEISTHQMSAPPSPFDQAAEAEMWERIQAALDELPPLDREIMCQFYRHERSWPEICDRLKITYDEFRLRKTQAKKAAASRARQIFALPEAA